MEDCPGQGNRAARLGDQARAKDNAPHGLANLRLSDRHDVIDKSLYVSKIECANALRSQSIRGGPRGLLSGEGYDTASLQALRGVGGQFRLDPNYPYLGPSQFHSSRDSAKQTASAHRRQHQISFRPVGNNLQAAGPLAGNNVAIIVRWYDDISELRRQLLCLGLAFRAAGPTVTISAPSACVAFTFT